MTWHDNHLCLPALPDGTLLLARCYPLWMNFSEVRITLNKHAFTIKAVCVEGQRTSACPSQRELVLRTMVRTSPRS